MKDIGGQRFGRLVAIERVFHRGRPHWRCVCDCGKFTMTRIDDLNYRRTTSCGCARIVIMGKLESAPNWKGGVCLSGGYVMEYRPEHPRASRGYVLQHILIAEKALGRDLPLTCEVHHVDTNRAHNENSNLVICQDKRYHKLLHARMRIISAGGNPNKDKICSRCKGCLPREHFSLCRTLYDGLARVCKTCDYNRRKGVAA